MTLSHHIMGICCLQNKPFFHSFSSIAFLVLMMTSQKYCFIILLFEFQNEWKLIRLPFKFSHDHVRNHGTEVTNVQQGRVPPRGTISCRRVSVLSLCSNSHNGLVLWVTLPEEPSLQPYRPTPNKLLFRLIVWAWKGPWRSS